MNKLKTINTSAEKRGFTTKQFDNTFNLLSDEELIKLLADNSAQKRTAAANLLNYRKCSSAICPLCDALKMEKALYSKISICNALAGFGTEALPFLIPLLGEIGNNRHENLPVAGFYKKSYPLPRDIVARIIIRIGEPALIFLREVLISGSRKAVLEAVDAVGHISFYSKNELLKNDLVNLYNKNLHDELLLWKILRAFQGINSVEINTILEEVIYNSKIPVLRWEAARSLALNGGLFGAKVKQFIPADSDVELRKIAERFIVD